MCRLGAVQGLRTRRGAALLLIGGCLVLAGCGGDDDAGEADGGTTQSATAPQETVDTDLSAVQTFLGDHTEQLTGFTHEFNEHAAHYAQLAEEENGDLEALWAAKPDEVGPLLEDMKSAWIEGNPYYERVEGIVAGTPSLAEYDVILDAGSSAAEDPESAVPFDLELADGTVLKQPGNLFNLTEGALWGTLPEALGHAGTPADLDGDGTTEFGEVLPDPQLLLAASETFDKYATELDEAGKEWEPAASDALTALVVMVPTMSEYFGQWKVSRFVAGENASGDSFNVVSRLADIRDILTGLEVIYDSVEPAIAKEDEERAAQTGQELADLNAFVSNLHDREQGGKRYTPEQADTLGTEAQERATAIAGQVSQAAAQLGVEIQQ